MAVGAVIDRPREGQDPPLQEEGGVGGRFVNRPYGGLEAGLSYLLGGIGKLGGKFTGNVIDKIVDKVDSIIGKVAIKLGGKVLAEVGEENLQAILGPWYKELTTHIKQERPGWEEFAYNSLLTAITTVLLEGNGAVKSGKTSVNTGNLGKIGWDGRAVVKDATGKSITMDGKKYEFLGYDEKGSPVYQDAEVLKAEQAARGKEAADQSEAEADEKTAQTENNKELSQSDSGKAMEAESLQDRVEKNEDRDILTLSSRYLNKNDSLYEYSKKIKPLDGFEDVVTHGDPVSLVFKDGDGKESNVSAEEFVKILRSDPNYKGGNIRLVACQVAANGGAIPKYIAKELGVTVIAPTESVNVDWDGNILLADNIKNIRLGLQTGEWLVFEPGKEGVSLDLYWRLRRTGAR